MSVVRLNLPINRAVETLQDVAARVDRGEIVAVAVIGLSEGGADVFSAVSGDLDASGRFSMAGALEWWKAKVLEGIEP